MLNAFILSHTSYSDLLNVAATSKADLESRNVLFMEDSGNVYLGKLFNALVA